MNMSRCSSSEMGLRGSQGEPMTAARTDLAEAKGLNHRVNCLTNAPKIPIGTAHVHGVEGRIEDAAHHAKDFVGLLIM